MNEGEIPLHKIETVPIDVPAGNEWELVCNDCSFRARFSQDSNQGANRLEILNIGDPQARHMGNQGSANVHSQHGHSSAMRQRNEEEAWLTPELRQKLNEILQGLD